MVPKQEVRLLFFSSEIKHRKKAAETTGKQSETIMAPLTVSQMTIRLPFFRDE
jgi:hypothetical protein